MVDLLRYDDSLKGEFERLNRAWIEKYFVVEATDCALFENPRGAIVDPGGEIFFARCDGKVVGTCAAQRLSADEWELAKLGVDGRFQGRGIGRTLCEAVIDHCRNAGGRRIVIESNRRLSHALRLYGRLGFVEFTPPEPSPFARADIFLQLMIR